MTITKRENGISLVPETEFEKECLRHIYGKALKTQWEDNWNQTGGLEITFEPHPWDRPCRHARDEIS